MLTSEGKKIDRACPLSEYPTPQFARDSYFCLNGLWDFCLDESLNAPSQYPSKIVVPFSPETPLSGIERKVHGRNVMHYRKEFQLPEGFRGERVLIHFEAVDQIADVYLNGVKIAHHEGGYLPFTADCLELKQGKNVLRVDVVDDTNSDVFPRGKQSLKPGGIWYRATSGIWGTVWMECVPKQVIQNLRITPLFDEKFVEIQAQFEGKAVSSQVMVSYAGRTVYQGDLDASLRRRIDLSKAFHPWSPEDPALYDVRVKINQDEVTSYFGMRKFSIVERKGHLVFALNNKPYFLSGLLDQGYFPDGGLTPPSDAAMINDIRLAKSLGFNMLRKHIKIDNMRWYYHCDRLGMIVIQDFVSGGTPVKKRLFLLAPFFNLHINDTEKRSLLGRKNPLGCRYFEEEMPLVVQRLYNVTSLAIWTLFNEGWGQFDSVRLTESLRKLDPTRLIDSTSGWFDQGAGDICSYHIYFGKMKRPSAGNRLLALSECGAYSYLVEGHVEAKGRIFYRYFSNEKKLMAAIEKLYLKKMFPLREAGLSIVVYTQLSDVESETNGLVTYDRRIVKVKDKKMREINRRLAFTEGEDD